MARRSNAGCRPWTSWICLCCGHSIAIAQIGLLHVLLVSLVARVDAQLNVCVKGGTVTTPLKDLFLLIY
ncbi:hypothetical protein DPEC_G00040320, partial [Dallia pectoralis]